VVELKTGHVKTNFLQNVQEKKPKLATGSIYEPAREKMEQILRTEAFEGNGLDPHAFARSVVRDILRASPPRVVYRGDSAWGAKWIPMLPLGMLDGMMKRTFGLDVVERMLKAARVH